MRTIIAVTRKHPVLAYFGLTFAISWGGLLALAGVDGSASTENWQSDPLLPWLFVAMLAGPSTAGLLLTGLIGGRSGFRELRTRLVRWRLGAGWYAVVLLAAPVVFGFVHFLLSFVSPAFLPTIVTAPDKAVFASALAGALVVGVLEELGWTGFATRALRRHHAPLATAVMVGVPWGAWHLLTNDIWIARGYSGELSPAVFALVNGVGLLIGQLPAYRVLMVWVDERTDSVFAAMLMHASLSACTFILGPAKVTGLAAVAYGFVLAAAWWAVVGLVAMASRAATRRPSRTVTQAA